MHHNRDQARRFAQTRTVYGAGSDVANLSRAFLSLHDKERELRERCAHLERERDEWAKERTAAYFVTDETQLAMEMETPEAWNECTLGQRVAKLLQEGHAREQSFNTGRHKALGDLAEARDRCASLEAALREAAEFMDYGDCAPVRGHTGPCTPGVTDCDGDCSDFAAFTEMRERFRALLGPSPEGSQPTLKDVGQAWHEASYAYWERYHAEGLQGAVVWCRYADGALSVYTRGEYADHILDAVETIDGPTQSPHCFDSEPPEGTETGREALGNEGAGAGDREASGRVAVAEEANRPALNDAPHAASLTWPTPVPSAPSPLHGERCPRCGRADPHSHPAIPGPGEPVSPSGYMEARHLSTRTTPDPAPPVSLPEGLRILADGVIEWRDQGGDFIQTSIEDGEFYASTSESPRSDAAGFGILARIDQVVLTLHRAGLLPGATLTEDQRRDQPDPFVHELARMVEENAHANQLRAAIRQEKRRLDALSTLGGDE